MMVTSNKLLCFLSIFVLCSCTVGPDYERPQIKLPEQWSEVVSDNRNGSSHVKWWENFQDKILNDLIEKLIERNFDLKGAESLIRQNQALFKESTLNFLPKLNLGGDATVDKISKSMSSSLQPKKYNLFTVDFQPSWEIDLFGRLVRQKEEALANLNAQIAEYYGIFLSLVSNMTQTYINLRASQENLRIVNLLCQHYKELYELELALKTAGLSDGILVATAQANWEGAEALKPPLEALIKNYIHLLSIFVGQDPRALEEVLQDILPLPSVNPEIFLGLPSDLLEQRPDVKVAEMNLAASTAKIGIAKSAWFPSFQLTGQWGQKSYHGDRLLSSTNNFYVAGLGVLWNIFDFGRVKQEILAAESFKDYTFFVYRQTILNALREVEDALINYGQDQVKLVDLKKAEAQIQSVVTLSEARYKSGLDSRKTYLQSNINLLNQKLAVLVGRQAIALDVVNLYKTLGGGWQGSFSPNSEGKNSLSEENPLS